MKPPLSSSSSSLLRKARLSPYVFTLLAFILFVAILYGEDFVCIFGEPLQIVTDLGQPVSRTGELTQPTRPLNTYCKIINSFLIFVCVCVCFGVREEVGEVAFRHREDRGRVWCVQREMGLGRESAALPRIRVSVHTAPVDLPGTWTPREGLSVLEVAASWLLSPQVPNIYYAYVSSLKYNHLIY